MSRRGFTLLELLVAMTIFSIVVAAAYALFHASRAVQSRAEARAEIFQTARAALRALEDDLRGAVLSPSAFDTGLVGTNRGSEDEPQDKIEVLAVNQHTANVDEKNPRIDLSKVTYWIADGTSGKARGLVRERQHALNSQTVYTGREESVEEVAPDVVGLNLRFYDGRWEDAWDSTQKYKLPKAIEVAVLVRGVWRDEEFTERFTTRVYLCVGAETPEKQPQ